MDDDVLQDLRAQLVERRDEIHDRWQRIEADRRHQDEPLDKDLEDQSLELENEEVLNQLDPALRGELRDILAALERIDEGTYGTCVECGDAINVARLEVLPSARMCIQCAEEAEL